MFNQKLLKIKLNFIENTINTSNEVLEMLIKDESYCENKTAELMETVASYNRVIQSSIMGLKFKKHYHNDTLKKLIENTSLLSLGRVSSIAINSNLYELTDLIKEDYIHTCRRANIALLDNIKIIKETI